MKTKIFRHVAIVLLLAGSFSIWVALIMTSCNTLERTYTEDIYPAVSPDGQYIVYIFNVVNTETDNYLSSGLYVISINGTEEKLLFPTGNSYGIPALCWSQDGRKLATTEGTYTIKNSMVTDFRAKSNEINLYLESWSPDGKNFLCDDRSKLFLCDTFFNNIRELPFIAACPRWMPDGKHIVCSMWSTLWTCSEICITDTLGTDTIRLTHNGGSKHDITPSPDGTMIAWGEDYSIFVMNSDGTNQRKLDNGRYPAWTPDSKYIVYTQGNITKDWRSYYIWKISIDGKEKIQITKNKKNK